MLISWHVNYLRCLLGFCEVLVELIGLVSKDKWPTLEVGEKVAYTLSMRSCIHYSMRRGASLSR